MLRAVKGESLVLCFRAWRPDRGPHGADNAELKDVIAETLRTHGLEVAHEAGAKGRIVLAPFDWYRPPLAELGTEPAR